MGVLNQEEKRKKAKHKAIDALDAIGHEREKIGIREAKRFIDEWDKKDLDKRHQEVEKLSKSVKFKRIEYHRILHEMFSPKVMSLERPQPGYWAKTGYNESGVWVKLFDRMGRSWQRGIKPRGEPELDYAAALRMALAVEDKMWEIEDDPKTNKGVYIPEATVL